MSRVHIRVPDSLHRRIEAIRFEGESQAGVVRRLLLNLMEADAPISPEKVPTDPPMHPYTATIPDNLRTAFNEMGDISPDVVRDLWLWIVYQAASIPLPEPWGDSGELLAWLQDGGYAVAQLAVIRHQTRNLVSDETLKAWLQALADDGEILLRGARGRPFKGSLQVLPYPRALSLQEARQHLYSAGPPEWFREWLGQGFTLTLARTAIATVKLAEGPYPQPMQMLGRQGGADLTDDCTQAEFYKALRKALMRMGAPETRSDSPYAAMDPIIDVYWLKPKWGDKAIKIERIDYGGKI